MHEFVYIAFHIFANLNVTADHAAVLWDRFLQVLGGGRYSLIERAVVDPAAYFEAVKALMDIADVWIGNRVQGIP